MDSRIEKAALAMARWEARGNGTPIPVDLDDSPKAEFWRLAAAVALIAADSSKHP
jgi:hypothetical protein